MIDQISSFLNINLIFQFTITKKIAKHGKQAIIVVPKLSEEQLRPGTVVELKIEVIEKSKLERFI